MLVYVLPKRAPAFSLKYCYPLKEWRLSLEKWLSLWDGAGPQVAQEILSSVPVTPDLPLCDPITQRGGTPRVIIYPSWLSWYKTYTYWWCNEDLHPHKTCMWMSIQHHSYNQKRGRWPTWPSTGEQINETRSHPHSEILLPWKGVKPHLTLHRDGSQNAVLSEWKEI